MKKNRCATAAFRELSPRVAHDKKTWLHYRWVLPMKKNRCANAAFSELSPHVAYDKKTIALLRHIA
jgi:hypothetical protein